MSSTEKRRFPTLAVVVGSGLLVALAACKGPSTERPTSEQSPAAATPAALPTNTVTVTSSPAPPATIETTFEVTGMHCPTCPITVRTAAKGVPGVSEARVNTDQARAWVTYDPRRTSPDAIAAAITESGYPAMALGAAGGSSSP